MLGSKTGSHKAKMKHLLKDISKQYKNLKHDVADVSALLGLRQVKRKQFQYKLVDDKFMKTGHSQNRQNVRYIGLLAYIIAYRNEHSVTSLST